MIIKELLERIGLKDLESEIYLFLLEKKFASAGVIAKSLGIQRSTVYYLLNALQKKGFVHYSLKGKKKLFQANDPRILEEYTLQTYEQVKDAIPKLLSKRCSEEKDEALLFVGYKGLFSAYHQMLSESKIGEEFLILGARGGEDISVTTYRNFYKNFNKKRIEKKIKQRILMNLDLKKELGSYYEKLPKTKVKYINQKTLAPIIIFPTAIAIVQWKEEPSLFLIRSNIINDSFKQYFEALWQTID